MRLLPANTINSMQIPCNKHAHARGKHSASTINHAAPATRLDKDGARTDFAARGGPWPQGTLAVDCQADVNRSPHQHAAVQFQGATGGGTVGKVGKAVASVALAGRLGHCTRLQNQ